MPAGTTPMKIDPAFPLETAAWPALWVDPAGNIRQANQAAIAAFGSILEASSPLLSSVWAPENEGSADQFVARLVQLTSPTATLRLRLKGGIATAFHTLITPWKGPEDRKGYLLQLFREQDPLFRTLLATTPPTGKPPLPTPTTPVDSAIAHKQKLDCAMQLIRTVALEFNNALTSILAHTSLILSRCDPDHPFRSSLIEVEKSAEKAAEIAEDLAGFSRQERVQKTVTTGNLNDLLRRTIALFQSPNPKPGIQWDCQFEARLLSCQFDEAKLQQALVKVLENAVQAITEPGIITIATRNVEVSAPPPNTPPDLGRLAPGHFVCIEITDTGCGIAPESLPRAFEPFFSTKPGHRGLGLAWVYGIVTNHGGNVSIESTPSRGSTVRIHLPAQNKVIRDSSIRSEDLFGFHTILMVDDEDLLLTMAEMILPAFGYRVLTANNGARALEILEVNKGQIDLVITDMVMPNMSGRELVERIRTVDPSVRIICTSGYVRPTSPDEPAYLQKPFTSQSLLRKVKDVLA